MRIVALDPGGTTGWTQLDYPNPQHWHQGQIGPGAHHMQLWDFLWVNHPDVLVVEQFNYQRRELTKGVSLRLDSKEYIGVAHLYAQVDACRIVMQQPPQKDFWTDDRLKKLGLWIPGKGHAMDATRHLLYYITFTLKDQTYLKRLA